VTIQPIHVWVKSGSAEVRDAGVLMGKKREILGDVSRFLPGYNRIVQTFAMGITWECGSLPITDTLCYIMMDYITIMTLN